MASLLLAGFVEETVAFLPYGALEPLRRDLALSYARASLLLVLYPGVGLLGTAFGVLADRRSRRALAAGGAWGYAAGLLLFAGAGNFPLLVVAVVLMGVAGDAMVRATEVALVDAAGDAVEPALARATLLGTFGDLAGPALLGACLATGLGWRAAFVVAGVAMAAYGLLLATQPLPGPHAGGRGPAETGARGEARGGSTGAGEAAALGVEPTGGGPGQPGGTGEAEAAGGVGGTAAGGGAGGTNGGADQLGAGHGQSGGAAEPDAPRGTGNVLAVVRDRRVLRLGLLTAVLDVYDEPFLAFAIAYLTAARGQPGSAVTLATGVGLAGGVAAAAWASRADHRGTPPALVAGLLVGGVAALLAAPHVAVAAAGAAGVGAAVNLGWISVQTRFLTLRPGQAGTTSAVVSAVAQVATVVPLAVGLVADRAGLVVAMLAYLALAAVYAAATALRPEPPVTPSAE